MTVVQKCPACHLAEAGCKETNGELVCNGAHNGAPPGYDFVRETLGGSAIFRRVTPGSGGPDSIPDSGPPYGGELSSTESWQPVLASALRGGGEEIPWVWDGYVARGCIALLNGLWKAGKTTLLAHLVRGMGDGSEVARPLAAGRVLVVSEESPVLWARRRDELEIGDHAGFVCRPFKQKPDYPDWLRFLNHVAELVKRDEYALVVFDTISAFLPLRDENDAAQMLRALMPLQTITTAGAGVLLVHHPRKGDAGEGRASRGSGALPSFVDVIIELRRYDAKSRTDRRRTLTAYSRFDETPAEVVVELTEQGQYRACGSSTDAKREDRLAVIRTLLPRDAPGLTVEQVREQWPDDEGGIPKPSARTIKRDLYAAPDVDRCGTGAKNDPHRFSIRTV